MPTARFPENPGLRHRVERKHEKRSAIPNCRSFHLYSELRKTQAVAARGKPVQQIEKRSLRL